MLQRQEEAQPQSAGPSLRAEQEGTAPAATQRVTPEELSAALEALESSRQEEARRVQQTVAIGEVVRELDLNVTPEEIWQQVQAQRAQKPAESRHADALNDNLHAAAQHARKAAGQAAAVAQAAAAEALARAEARRDRRHTVGFQHRRRNGLIAAAIALICVGAAVTSSPHHGLVISGDDTVATYSGSHKSAEISGDNETITLRGDCRDLVISGDHDRITVLGKVTRVTVSGDENTVTWTQEPDGQSTTIVDSGDGNRIEPAPSDKL